MVRNGSTSISRILIIREKKNKTIVRLKLTNEIILHELPLSIIFVFSQYWILSSLMKRLELLFLGVFA